MVEYLGKNYRLNDSSISNRELRGIRWKDSKTKHFVTIIKILAEKGSCTIREIVENDGFSKVANKVSARQDIYSRVINGSKSLGIVGLKSKGLIAKDSQVMKSKPTNQYKLSWLGIFYAIRIFTPELPLVGDSEYEPRIKIKQGKISEEDSIYKDSILEVLAKNYSDDLPLIFGKWEFLKKNFKSFVNFLVEISFLTKGGLEQMHRNELYSNRPFTMFAGLGAKNLYPDEISVWFYGRLFDNVGYREFQEKLKKDKEIFDWYSAFISKLLEAKNEEIWGIRHADYTMKGEFEKADKMLEKLLRFQGLEKDKNSEKLVLIKRSTLQ